MRLPGRPPALWAACAGCETGPAPSPALSAATMAPQPSAPAAASAVAEAVGAAVDRHALLAINAAGDRPAGGEVDGEDRWRDLLALGPAGHVAGRRDAPVEMGQNGTKWRARRSEAGGHGAAYMHAHGARALELGGGGNGDAILSGRRLNIPTGNRSACCRRLPGGARAARDQLQRVDRALP